MGPGDVGTPGPLVNFRHMPLSERLELANEELIKTFRRKARLARTGVTPYPTFEVYWDFHVIAEKYEVIPGALWVYFWTLYTP